MDRSLPLFLIGLVFGGGIGFTIAASSGVTLDGHDHTDPAQHGAHSGSGDGMAHDHDMPLVLEGSASAPTLQLDVQPDPVSGWNLHLATTNFAFAPENAGRAHQPGQGHAHVYVNGTKIGRLYGPWMHIATLPKGEVTVKATLNANDHRPLSVDGQLIEQTLSLTN